MRDLINIINEFQDTTGKFTGGGGGGDDPLKPIENILTNNGYKFDDPGPDTALPNWALKLDITDRIYARKLIRKGLHRGTFNFIKFWVFNFRYDPNIKYQDKETKRYYQAISMLSDEPFIGVVMKSSTSEFKFPELEKYQRYTIYTPFTALTKDHAGYNIESLVKDVEFLMQKMKELENTPSDKDDGFEFPDFLE